jgi:gas vesicle protein
MAHHDELPYIVIERQSGAVLPFLWGALLGATVALLWAPRSGRETQTQLHEAADRLGNALRDRVDDARGSVSDVVDDARQRVQDRFGAVRDAVETRTEGVKHAFESGRRAAQEAREELEFRVAEAKRAVETDPLDLDLPDEDIHVDVVVTERVEERPSRTDRS